MKIVFDTNVILSAFLTEGLSYKVLDKCLNEHELIISEWIINEVETKLKEKFNVPDAYIRELINFLKKQFILVEPTGIIPQICRDKDDNNILHLVQHSKAEVIITGDKDLLTLKSYKNCYILNPRKFLEKYLK